MAVAIRMPDLGTTVEEIELVAWRVKEGDRIQRGDMIAEIKTDKAASELESVAEGTVLKLMIGPGTVARTGDVLAYVGQPGEVLPQEAPAPSRAVAETVRVSPIVRNLAAKLGVDLAAVRGSGQGGTLTREDVLAAGKSSALKPPPADAEMLPRAQSAVAKAVLSSVREIPHLHVSAAMDMTALERLRAESARQGRKISYDAFFLKAMAAGVRAVPLLAARLDGERIIRPTGLHIAVAIGIENELFLPVIRDVDRKDLAQIQGELEAVAAQVKARKLAAEHMAGACMTLSNLGMYPIESFDAIIFPEHSAILAVGAAQKKPAAVGDRVEVRSVAVATLAADHRLINGRTAAQFLCQVKESIEAGAFV